MNREPCRQNLASPPSVTPISLDVILPEPRGGCWGSGVEALLHFLKLEAISWAGGFTDADNKRDIERRLLLATAACWSPTHTFAPPKGRNAVPKGIELRVQVKTSYRDKEKPVHIRVTNGA